MSARSRLTWMLALVLIGVGAARPVAADASSDGPAARADSGRNPASLPVTGAVLHGIAHVTPNDVWVVGVALPNFTQETVTEHWDGTAWQRIPSPNPGIGGALESVSALTADDVWAVGHYTPATGAKRQVLILHWDGTAWSVAPNDYEGAPWGDGLNDVVAISSDNAWAVGQRYPKDADHPVALIEHWDGTTWSRSIPPEPRKSSLTKLAGVTALSPTSVLAVGSAIIHERQLDITHSVGERFDGTSWHLQRVARDPRTVDYLDDVSAESASSAWAVGAYRHRDESQTRGMAQRFDGTAWSMTPVEQVGSIATILSSASASSPTEAWAAGTYTNDGSTTYPLVEHWDGTEWSSVPSHVPAGWALAGIQAIDSISPNDAWFDGTYYVDSQPVAFVGHWNGKRWTVKDL